MSRAIVQRRISSSADATRVGAGQGERCALRRAAGRDGGLMMRPLEWAGCAASGTSDPHGARRSSAPCAAAVSRACAAGGGPPRNGRSPASRPWPSAVATRWLGEPRRGSIRPGAGTSQAYGRVVAPVFGVPCEPAQLVPSGHATPGTRAGGAHRASRPSPDTPALRAGSGHSPRRLASCGGEHAVHLWMTCRPDLPAAASAALSPTDPGGDLLRTVPGSRTDG